jgi:hypothetical protein
LFSLVVYLCLTILSLYLLKILLLETFTGESAPGMISATGASILSAPFINPIRMIEKQQRAYFKQTGKVKPIMEILRESAQQYFRPLFRGTVPLMGHSLASATLGLVGQPRLQKHIQSELGSKTSLGRSATGFIASAIVSPIYVIVTNPLSRLEVIMQTNSIQGKPIGVLEACKEMIADSKQFGLRGVFRGQGNVFYPMLQYLFFSSLDKDTILFIYYYI